MLRRDRVYRVVFRVAPLMLVTIVALSSMGAMLAREKSDDSFIVRGGLDDRMQEVTPFATLELGDGHEIFFVGLEDDKGRTGGVLVGESTPAHRMQLVEIDKLRDLNPRELWNALATERTREPLQLVEQYELGIGDGQRGWARDLITDRGAGAPLPCSPSDIDQVTLWGDLIEGYAGQFNHETPFKSLYDGPVEKPAHWAKLPGDGLGNAGLYELNGSAHDVTAFYSSVIFCSEDPYNAATYNGQYVGNYANFFFRPAGHGTWNFIQSEQLDEVGKIVQYLYYPADPFAGSATSFDFHLELTQVKPYDQFHIGATWVRSMTFSDITLGS